MKIVRQNGRRSVEFGPIIGTFVFLPLMVVAAGLSIPYGYAKRISDERKARCFEERMKSANRLLSFEEFERKLRSNEGTYISEYRAKGPHRFWWTSDNLYKMSPVAIVSDLTMSVDPDPAVKVFARWCFDRYVSPNNGKAFLVAMPRERGLSLKEKLRNARGVSVLSVRESVW